MVRHEDLFENRVALRLHRDIRLSRQRGIDVIKEKEKQTLCRKKA
jgi:hypothetical protein